MAILLVTRPSGGVDRRRKYRVFLDGRKVARIRSDSQTKVEVSPGSHCLEVRSDWVASNCLYFEAGETPVEVVVRPRYGPWRLAWKLYTTLFFTIRRREFIVAELASPAA